MKVILEFIKNLFGGLSTKVIVYGVAFCVLAFAIKKAYVTTKNYHYANYVRPHVEVVRDSLKTAFKANDSLKVSYYKLQDSAVQDSVIARDLISKLQVQNKQLNDRIKVLKYDCRDVMVIKEKYGLFGGLKSSDTTIIVK